jgi:predicted ester cyclase
MKGFRSASPNRAHVILWGLHPMNDLAQNAHAIIHAINARDYTTVLAHLDPAYESTWPHATLDLIGSGAHEQQMLQAFPDLVFEITNTVVSEPTVVLELVARGTHTGVLTMPGEPDIPASGATLRLPMVFVQEFVDTKLRNERLYFDQLTMRRQLGADAN